jgi:DNA replication protein DnaC
MIGKHKYQALVSLDLINLDEATIDQLEKHYKLTVGEALKLIEEYEAQFIIKSKDHPSALEYFEKINEPKEHKEKKFITKEWLWERFIKNYKKNEGVSFKKTADTVENIKPLILYFIGDEENFIKCQNVSLKSKPNLKKGLLIIGDKGNGKTTIMRAIQDSLRGTNAYFTTKPANDIVTMYENCSNEFDKSEFWKHVTTGVINFDDLLTERDANNYGKITLMKDVIEKRYDKKKRTYVSCNFHDKYPDDLDEGLKQIYAKYGSRAYDRIFEMFNVIIFKGKSFRR